MMETYQQCQDILVAVIKGRTEEPSRLFLCRKGWLVAAWLPLAQADQGRIYA